MRVLIFLFICNVGNSQSRFFIQEYKNIAEFQSAIFPVPKENDKVFVESQNAIYDYSKNSTTQQDTLFCIKQNSYNGRWFRVGNAPYVLSTKTNVSENAGTMSPISELTLSLTQGRYKITFEPIYNVNATTTGSGWNFQGGTAILSEYAFVSNMPSSPTTGYNNYYAAANQNFTTAQTSRLNENRAIIQAWFTVTTAGTLIPHFRSELAGGSVTLKAGSIIKLEKFF